MPRNRRQTAGAPSSPQIFLQLQRPDEKLRWSEYSAREGQTSSVLGASLVCCHDAIEELKGELEAGVVVARSCEIVGIVSRSRFEWEFRTGFNLHDPRLVVEGWRLGCRPHPIEMIAFRTTQSPSITVSSAKCSWW